MENFNKSISLAMSGSIVRFRKAARPEFSNEEKEIDQENREFFTNGIRMLRKLRTQALAEENLQEQQNILNRAHLLAEETAGAILGLAQEKGVVRVNDIYKSEINILKSELETIDAGSGYGNPAYYSVNNLYLAADDLLIRIKESVGGALENPSHTLTQEELAKICEEFFIHTNDYSREAVKRVFSAESKAVGVLTGGSVFLEMVKQVVKRYGENSLSLNTAVVAVDKNSKNTAFEKNDTDIQVKEVFILDDMINEGNTVLAAVWAAGENFPNASIYSGLQRVEVGQWLEKKKEELGRMFYVFADLVEEGKKDEAVQVLAQAIEFSKKHNIEMTPAWQRLRQKLES